LIKEETIWKALQNVLDPEIGLSVVDMGLIYEVKVKDEGKVYVKMTLTAPGCPLHALITQNVKNEVERLDGVKEAEVELTFDPPWTPERMSEALKRRFGYA